MVERVNDLHRQVLTERWQCTEMDAAEQVVREEEEILTLRWSVVYSTRAINESSRPQVERTDPNHPPSRSPIGLPRLHSTRHGIL